MNLLRCGLAVVVMAQSVQLLNAQFYYFGQNKVQYTEFDWRVLRTEHFDIYYYTEMKDLAERGGAFAEETYKEYENLFNFTIGHRVPLVFYSTPLYFQQTNITPGFIPENVGGFFEFIKGRVVIPADGSISQFRHVIRHELVHVFMRSKINRVLVDHRQTIDREPPLWFSEGLAEYISSTWDSQAEWLMRDVVLNDYLVPLAHMDAIAGTFLMYKEGQLVLSYVAERYGREKILLLMENFWRSTSFQDDWKFTLGVSYEQFDEQWTYAMKKRYFPLLGTTDQPTAIARTVVKEGFNAKPVFYRPDSASREVIFIGNHTGYTNVYRKSLDSAGTPVRRIVEGERTDEFEAFHLFSARMDVSKQGLLAFVTKSGENDALHIYDLKRNELVDTYHFKDLVSIGSPSWSPDGNRIVLSAIGKSGYDDLYIFDRRERTLDRLTDDFYDDRDPAWSPDGRWIAFRSDRTAYGSDGNYNLFLYSVDTRTIEYLTNGDEDYGSPAWSPDGSMLAFICDANGARDIWMMAMADRPVRPLHGGEIRRITNLTTAAFDPAWTDDGRLLFASFQKYTFQIMELDSVRQRFDTSSARKYVAVPLATELWTTPHAVGENDSKSFRYTPEYTLDLAQSAITTDPVFGTRGGAALAVSDMLGNDVYTFLVFNTAQAKSELLSSFNIAISRLSMSQRTNYAYGIFNFAGRRYDLTDPDLYFYERSFGGYLSLSYPLSRFKRIEVTTSIDRSDKSLFDINSERKALLLSNSVSFIHDNSLWGPTGPLDGSRFFFTLAYTTDIQYSNVSYYSVLADYRYYFRLGTYTAFASRFNVYYNEGKEARRYFMGGSWDLRGWDRWSIRGKKLWLTSQELRFPFVDQLVVRFPFGPINFGLLRGALFFDAGSAWDDSYQQTFGSVGAGVRWNLGGVLVLRYDVGKTIVDNFAKFQKGLFYQFFFGWDF